jgi:hypothetical protein
MYPPTAGTGERSEPYFVLVVLSFLVLGSLGFFLIHLPTTHWICNPEGKEYLKSIGQLSNGSGYEGGY